MTRLPRTLLLALLLAASLPLHAAGPTGLLNDTGQDTCYDGAALVACTPANSGDAAANPRQDGRFGRDAAAVAGTLSKTGAGAKSFDYTRVCMSGELAGQGACPASPAQGTGANQWACTKDNVTNLIWSLDSPVYNWTAATTTYPTAMNATSRCGYTTNWRLPTRRELLSIVNNGTWSPSIDSAYFPGTVSDWYWSADTYAPDPAYAWYVNFVVGDTGYDGKTYAHYVRLVRSGQ